MQVRYGVLIIIVLVRRVKLELNTVVSKLNNSPKKVRCAYQLGKGRPALAKLSAYKSMFLASMLTVLVATVFLCLGGVLPTWLTHDTTIQGMLVELFPLIALGKPLH